MTKRIRNQRTIQGHDIDRLDGTQIRSPGHTCSMCGADMSRRWKTTKYCHDCVKKRDDARPPRGKRRKTGDANA